LWRGEKKKKIDPGVDWLISDSLTLLLDKNKIPKIKQNRN